MMSWRSPSLTRRLVAALLLAFGLTATVLLAQSYLRVQREFREMEAGDSELLKQIPTLVNLVDINDDPRGAQGALRVIELQAHRSRQELGLQSDLLTELHTLDGERIYATPYLLSQGLSLAPPPIGQAEQILAGQTYRVAQIRGRHWRLVVAEPLPGDVSLITLLGGELAPSLLLAFPLVLLPVWLAVHQGLRPLRRLSSQLSQRSADDLAPLDIDLQYRELLPVAQAFNSLLTRLREKVQRERAFVQDAAHELRTPMAVIAAQAHLLGRATSEAERQQAEGALTQAIARTSHLAQQLLALASLDDSRPTQRQHVDVPHVLQSLLAQAMPLARQQGITLGLDAPDSLLAWMDLGALQSIAGNLIDNSLRYGRNGGEVRIQFEVDASGFLVLLVADDGPGIPPETRQRVFERFVRGPHVDVPGTGLGLAIVQQGARRLQGEVHIVGGLRGCGVGFRVRWPQRTAPQA